MTSPRGLLCGARAMFRDERGAATIEAAVVLPMLFAMTLGGIELGRALWIQASIHHAVHETARYATTHGAASGAAASEDDLALMAADLTDLPEASVTVTADFAPNNQPGSTVTVSLDHAYTPLSNLLLDLSGITLSSSATLTIVR